MNKLAVAETFLSIQGEGSTMGVPSYFLRLAGCNLICGGEGTQKDGKLHNGATWRCDTIEVWMKGKKKTHQEVIDLMGPEFINDLKDGVHLVITGGEPLLQQDSIIDFINYLSSTYDVTPFIEIETNGTIKPKKELVGITSVFNVSPKLENSGMSKEKRLKVDVLQYFNKMRPNMSIFKFVILTQRDWFEVQEIVDELQLKWSKVWLMPAAETRNDLDQVIPFVAKIAVQNRVKFSNRIHIQVWDKKTGV